MSSPSRPVPKPNGFSFTEPFWQAAREKSLVLQYCPDSGKFQHVPRPVSVYSGRRRTEWREVSGHGCIYAVTTLRIGRPEVASRLPLLAATIELDEKVRIIGNIIDSEPGACRIGARVELAWDHLDDGMPYPAFRVVNE
jgi:uncharacterized OB-fold protein